MLMRALLSQRRARQDFSAFAALIATPGNLATGVALPANAKLYITSTSALVAATVQVTCAGRNIGARIGAANHYSEAGWFERGSVVKKAGTAVGTVRVYIEDGVGTKHKIAQG